MSDKPEFKIKHTSDDGMPPLDEMIAAGDELERQEEQQKQPTNQDQGRKWINRVPIRRVTHIRLLDAANRRGMLYQDFCGRVLDDTMENFEFPDESEPNDERYVTWKVALVELEARLYDGAYHVAAIHSKRPTPATAEHLYDICERIGINPQELVDKAKNDIYQQVVAQSLPDLSSRRGNCRRFIMDITQNAGNEVAASVIFETGRKAGFTENMVRGVARELGWIPFKRGMKWYWKRTPIARLATSKSSSSSEIGNV